MVRVKTAGTGPKILVAARLLDALSVILCFFVRATLPPCRLVVAVRWVLLLTLTGVRVRWLLGRRALTALVDRRVVRLLSRGRTGVGVLRRRIVALLLLLRWVVVPLRVTRRIRLSRVRAVITAVLLRRVHVTAFMV